MTPTKVYGWNQGTGGTFWYRIAEPLRGLALAGHQTATGPVLTDEIVDEYDFIHTHLLHDERGSEAWEKLANRRGAPFLSLDVDDLAWAFERHTDTYTYWTPARIERLMKNIRLADVVTTPNQMLADELRTYNPNVVVVGNYVPEWVLGLSTYRPVTKYEFGFQGARQHTEDLQIIGYDMLRILRQHRNVRVKLYGELDPRGWPDGRVIRTPWQSDVPTYYRSLSFHAGLAPLRVTRFNLAKSALRAVEYAALGIPIIASKNTVYDDVVQEGATGWLVDDTEWYECLRWTYQNQDLAKGMGVTARRHAASWTTEANTIRWQRVFS